MLANILGLLGVVLIIAGIWLISPQTFPWDPIAGSLLVVLGCAAAILSGIVFLLQREMRKRNEQAPRGKRDWQ